MSLSITRPIPRDIPAMLPCLLVLIGGCLNGFAVRIIESWHHNGFASIFLGLSPFEFIAIFVAASLIATSSDADREPSHTYFPEFAAATAMLVPSSAVTWAVVAVYAGFRWSKSSGSARTGALLFALLALSALWSSVVIKQFALAVTTLDASIVGFAISMFKGGVVQIGNVVGVPHEHSLIVMTACSSLDGLPRVLVGLAAILLFVGTFTRQRFARAAAMIVAIYISANFIRLTLMAWSGDLYTVAHGPIGANVFDTLMTVSVFAIALNERSE